MQSVISHENERFPYTDYASSSAGNADRQH